MKKKLIATIFQSKGNHRSLGKLLADVPPVGFPVINMLLKRINTSWLQS
jgi:hypothetical protein